MNFSQRFDRAERPYREEVWASIARSGRSGNPGVTKKIRRFLGSKGVTKMLKDAGGWRNRGVHVLYVFCIVDICWLIHVDSTWYLMIVQVLTKIKFIHLKPE